MKTNYKFFTTVLQSTVSELHGLNNKTAFSSSKIKFEVHRIALLPLDGLGIGAWHLYSYLAFGLNSRTKTEEKSFSTMSKDFYRSFPQHISRISLQQQYHDPPPQQVLMLEERPVMTYEFSN